MTRKDAIKTLKELRRETNDYWYEEVYNMAIKALETVTSANRPQGKWIITEQDNGHKWTHRKCSECGKGVIEPLGVSAMKFCPNCGARMKGVDDV